MYTIENILRNTPPFRHCTSEEISCIRKISGPTRIKKGQLFDLKKVNSFIIVMSGVFEVESLGKTDVVYLSPGSFFGNIPFTENRNSGKIKAVVDSTLLLFRVEEMYRFFLANFKCLRGFLKLIDRMGFDVSEIGKRHCRENSRVITVFSPFPESGKSLFASLMGMALKKSGKTIVIDLSYSGYSLFNYFEKKITSPLSHKEDEQPSVEKVINERIVPVDNDLDLFNISYGSKVKVNPEILSPILFILSRKYRYIVLDLSDYDEQLRNVSLSLSDRIFTLLKSRRNFSRTYAILDEVLAEGQRVYYLLNEFFSGDVRNLPGGLVLEKLPYEKSSLEGALNQLMSINNSDSLAPMARLVTDQTRALAIQSNFLESVFIGGFLSECRKSDLSFDILYASSLSYIVAAIHILSGDRNDFRKRMIQFFTEERISKFLDVSFPDEYVFKDSSISKFCDEMAGNNRVEMYTSIPAVLAGENGLTGRRIFSTGFLRDLISLSFLVYPVFEQKKIAGNMYNSGYPALRVRSEDLLRTDVDEIISLSVEKKSSVRYRNERISNFYGNYLDFMDYGHYNDSSINVADQNIIVEATEKEMKVEKILDYTEEAASALIKDARLS